MISEGDRLFGRIAIVSGYLSRNDVLRLLKEKQQKAPAVPFGLFLVEEGVITREQYDEIMGIRREIDKRRRNPVREAPTTELEQKVDALLEELGIEDEIGAAADALEAEIEREPFPTEMPEDVEYLEGDFSHLEGAGLDEFLKTARELGASDFHYCSGSPPFLRIAGRFRFMPLPVLTLDDARMALLEIMTGEQRRRLFERCSLDFTYEAPHGRYRVNVFFHHRGIGGGFRIIDSRIRSLEELGLPPVVRKFTVYPHGLVLITGPAGSGKSTTLAALIEIINAERNDHIVMIEDPIEFVHESRSCNVTQREVGRDTLNFHVALRASLREDPDVIVVGEMRDLETVSMAITAAETGHLVFGTLHTTNATRTVDRILDVFPPREQPQIRAMLSESLRGVISQQLLPAADGNSRVLACEILFNTPAVANLIREAKTFQIPTIIQTSRKEGMLLMDDCILELLKKGRITLETALFYAEDPERVRKQFEGAS